MSMKALNSVLPHLVPSKSLTITTLPNGLRVATDLIPSDTVTICIGLDVGTRHDPDDLPGAVTLITRRAMTCRELKEMGELSGAYEKDRTFVHVTVPEEKMLRAFKILAHSVMDTAFDDGVIETEESFQMWMGLNKALKLTHQVMFNHLYESAFHNNPLGRTGFPPDESIGKMSKGHLKSFISTRYTAPRMVICVTGAVNHKHILKHVKKLFKRLSADPTTASQLVSKTPTAFTACNVRKLNNKEPVAHFALAFRGASITDSELMALKVIECMLGSLKHIGSEFARIIGVDGVDGTLETFNTNYLDTGLFGVYVKTEPYCLDHLANAIMSILSKLCSFVLKEDVNRAKSQVRSSFVRNIGGHPIAMVIAEDLLKYGHRVQLEEHFAKIDAVDADTVKRVAIRFFFDQDIAISALGPIEKLPDYDWFRSRTRFLCQ